MNEPVTLTRLPLEELHRESGAAMRESDGLLLPAHYGNRMDEYETVRGASGAGLFDLTPRGRIEVSGSEAVQFLNGLVTNDVKTLPLGAFLHAAFPNVQGRLLAFVRIMRPTEEAKFTIDTEAATHARVFQALARFTLAGDFHVRDLTPETVQLSLQGARAEHVIKDALGEAAAALARRQVKSVNWDEATLLLLRATHTGQDGYDLIAGKERASKLWRALQSAGARPCGYDALEVLRVEAGIPRYGADVDETTVVPEAGQDDAISYTKGCYIGQEIIARIHYRGHVAKRLAGLLLEDERTALRESKIKTVDGKDIGRVTSSVYSPRAHSAVALALVKYDYLQPGTELFISDGDDAMRAARVVELPFVSAVGSDEAN